MGSAVLLGSSYGSDGSQFYVRDSQYMYTNIDSQNRAEISSYSYDTNPHYLFLSGFNFSEVIPSGMVATSTTVKVNIDFYQGLDSSSNYYPMLCNGTTVVSSSPTKSGNIYTFSGLDWDTISSYGNNFGIRLCLRKSYAYASTSLHVYGAEIDVEYSEQSSSDTLYVKQNDSWVEATKAYKKIDGSWVEQDITTLFDTGTNYYKAN